jgi:hypothetical protein
VATPEHGLVDDLVSASGVKVMWISYFICFVPVLFLRNKGVLVLPEVSNYCPKYYKYK